MLELLQYLLQLNLAHCIFHVQKLFSAVSLGGLLKNEDKATLEERARGFILISAKKDITTPDSRLFFDVGIASQNIILIADELGYGACIVMSYNKKAFEEILDLPEDYDSKDEEDTKYFIENGIHHVPKLKLGDLILGKK